MLSPSGLQQRSKLLQTIRCFFHDREYVEVDTPVRLPVLLPEAHIQPITSEGWFLQTSPELYMKLLLSRGSRKLFQLCPCFRKEESGRLHRTEFTMLEWYSRGNDYLHLMDECEELFSCLVRKNPELAGVADGRSLVCKQRVISLNRPWQRISVSEAFRRFAHVEVEQAIAEDRYEELLVEYIEPRLGWETPVFLFDYPISLASLARPKKGRPDIAERFELYIGGVELANGFSELVDPEIQRRRFEKEIEHIASRGGCARMPELFLDALEHLGESAGIALGVDRLVMLMMGRESVGEVLPLG